MAKGISHQEFVWELNTRNPKIKVIGQYKNSLTRVDVKCKSCSWVWSPIGGSLLRGHSCPKCGGKMQKTHQEFVEDLKSKRDDVIIVGNYEKALRKARFKFLGCGHEWDVTPAKIFGGRGCPLCANARKGDSQRLTLNMFSERLNKIDQNLGVLEGANYINYNTPIALRCNACKYEYEIKPSDVLHSGGCPICHKACTSFLEQFIYHTFTHILGNSEVISRNKAAIGFELDIYIPELNAAIEPGSWYWHKSLVARDRQKEVLCKEKGIRLITIYDHYDESYIPFDNCIVTNCDLVNIRNRDKLIEITKVLLSEFGLDSNLDISVWEKIAKRAQIDSRRMSTEQFKDEITKINNKIEIIGKYTKANDKIKVRCKICNYEWNIAPTTLRLGSGCGRCAGKAKITDEAFVERLNLLQPSIILLTEFINMKTKVMVKCKLCGHIWTDSPLHLISKFGRNGCRVCSRKYRRTHDDFVSAIAQVSPEIKIVGTFVSVNKSILVQCRKCNYIWQSYAIGLLWGSSSCEKCVPNHRNGRKGRKVRCIGTGEIFNTIKEAAEVYNASPTAIRICCAHPSKRKLVGGYEWDYITIY